MLTIEQRLASLQSHLDFIKERLENAREKSLKDKAWGNILVKMVGEFETTLGINYQDTKPDETLNDDFSNMDGDKE